jgi:hypothetical protein
MDAMATPLREIPLCDDLGPDPEPPVSRFEFVFEAERTTVRLQVSRDSADRVRAALRDAA